MSLRVWWPRTPKPGNLGDVLTPVLLGRLGYAPRWTPQGAADVLASGSIIRFARAGQTVWGSGAMRATDRPDRRARYLAVRGPLTRRAVLAAGGSCPEVYGDPALLLAEFVNGSVPKVHDLGLVPHYVDRAIVASLHPNEHRIDVLRADPLDVVREIRECRAIVSSSLHGIIVAHAFGIPAAWVRWSDKLDGDDIKFHDYAASVGWTAVPCPDLASAEPTLPSGIDVTALLDAGRSL
jgi:hypothetical protein